MKVDEYFDSGFENADEYADSAGLIQSLEIQLTNSTLLDIRDRVFSAIQVNAGDEILEVGCGLGQTVRDIATFTNNTCKVTGIDKSAVLLHEALKRSDLNTSNIAFKQGDATQIEFEDNTFSFACAERVLMHIPNPKSVLKEMVRVLKKGGTLAITEPDLTSVEVYPDYKDISSKVVTQWCDYTESPAMGKNLLKYFQELGLQDIKVSVQPLTIHSFAEFEKIRSLKKLVTALEGNEQITSDDADMYLNGLTNQFLFYVNVYSVTGQK